MDVEAGKADGRYDAFVSYNRNADKKVAAALRMGLHQFARPWYRLRAVRVFVDDSTLPADSELWKPIERALDSSGYLIVLASTEAARSDGVDHELRYWLEHRPHDRILIGLTAGGLSAEQRADPTTNALPRALETWFARKPRYIDLRWMRDARDLSLRDARFQDAVAEFAATLRDEPKDDLHGEDVRQHRTAIRVRNAAIGVLVLLLGLVGIGFYNAVAERNIAQSRALAIEAEQLRSIDPAISRQLSVAAYAIAPTEEARSSLLSTASLWPVTRKFDHEGPTFGLAVSRQAALVASAGADGSVGLWSSATPSSPERLASVLVEQNLVTSVALTANGTVLAAGTADGMVGLWNVAAPRTPHLLGQLLRVGPGRITALAFDPAGHVLVIGGADGTLRAWDVGAPGAPRPIGAPVAGHAHGVRAVTVSADGSTVATGGDDTAVRLWIIDPRAGLRATGAVAGHDAAVTAVAFSPDGRTLATASSDRTVRLWDAGNRLTASGPALTGHDNAVYAVIFSPDGTTIASAGNDNTVRVWNVATHRQLAVLPHPQTVQAVAFLGATGELASAGNDGALRFWHLPGARLGADAPLLSVVASPDDRMLYAGGLDGRVNRWDISDAGHPVLLGALAPARAASVQRMSITSDGRLLAVPWDDGRLELWDVADAAHPRMLAAVPNAHDGGVFVAAFRPDGRVVATGGPDRRVRLWDVADPGRPRLAGEPPPERTGAVFALAFSPDGRSLAAGGGEGATWLYDVTQSESPRQMDDPLGGTRGSVLAVAFDPGGSQLATAGEDGKVWLWDVTDRTRPPTTHGRPALQNAGGAVLAVAFGPSGRLATANADGSTWIWNPSAAGSAPEAKLIGPSQGVYGAWFSAGGDLLTTVGADVAGVLWRTDSAAASRAACAGVGDPLTRAEWSRYVAERAYAPPCAPDRTS